MNDLIIEQLLQDLFLRFCCENGEELHDGSMQVDFSSYMAGGKDQSVDLMTFEEAGKLSKIQKGLVLRVGMKMFEISVRQCR